MDDATGLLIGAGVLVAVALVVWFVGRAAARGTLGANHVAGLRTPATMSSPEAWRAGHAAAAGWLDASVVGGLVPAVAGGVAAVVGSTSWAAGLLLAGSLGLLAGVVVGGIVAHRAARAVRLTHSG